MSSSGWRLSGWIGVSILATVILIGVAPDAVAGRSGHLDYAESRGVELPTPDPDRALVVFVRPSSKGGDIHASVYDGEEFITFAQKNTCFIYDTEPGEHRFMVVSESADFLGANLQGGKIYFVEVRARMGMARARFSMFPVTKSDKSWKKLPQWLRQAFLVEPNQSAMNWVEGSMPSVMRKKTANLKKWEAKPPAARPTLNPDDGVTGL